jgi:hypothetical protein
MKVIPMIIRSDCEIVGTSIGNYETTACIDDFTLPIIGVRNRRQRFDEV